MSGSSEQARPVQGIGREPAQPDTSVGPELEQPTRTVAAALQEATATLRESGTETPRLDAELLVAHALQLSRVEVYTESQRPLEPPEVERIGALVRRRVAHEPVQYILGRAYFRNLELLVDRRVLIPRPETELLVEWVLEELEARAADPGAASQALRVLDVCTGSGAIALAIVEEAAGRAVEVTGADVSPDALAVARANAEGTGLSVEWLLGDLFEPVRGRTFDIVTANPPYIPTGDHAGLHPTVRDYEPPLALFVDHDDPMSLVRRIAVGAQQVLTPRGLLAIEVGAGQAAAAIEVLQQAGYDAVRVRQDLQGLDRIVGGFRASAG